LNIASFYVNKVTSALTLTIVANVKQVVVIILAVLVFHTPVSFVNACGVALVILGSIWYSVIGYKESEDKKALKDKKDQEEAPPLLTEIRLDGPNEKDVELTQLNHLAKNEQGLRQS